MISDGTGSGDRPNGGDGAGGGGSREAGGPAHDPGSGKVRPDSDLGRAIRRAAGEDLGEPTANDAAEQDAAAVLAADMAAAVDDRLTLEECADLLGMGEGEDSGSAAPEPPPRVPRVRVHCCACGWSGCRDELLASEGLVRNDSGRRCPACGWGSHLSIGVGPCETCLHAAVARLTARGPKGGDNLADVIAAAKAGDRDAAARIGRLVESIVSRIGEAAADFAARLSDFAADNREAIETAARALGVEAADPVPPRGREVHVHTSEGVISDGPRIVTGDRHGFFPMIVVDETVPGDEIRLVDGRGAVVGRIRNIDRRLSGAGDPAEIPPVYSPVWGDDPERFRSAASDLDSADWTMAPDGERARDRVGAALQVGQVLDMWHEVIRQELSSRLSQPVLSAADVVRVIHDETHEADRARRAARLFAEALWAIGVVAMPKARRARPSPSDLEAGAFDGNPIPHLGRLVRRVHALARVAAAAKSATHTDLGELLEGRIDTGHPMSRTAATALRATIGRAELDAERIDEPLGWDELSSLFDVSALSAGDVVGMEWADRRRLGVMTDLVDSLGRHLGHMARSGVPAGIRGEHARAMVHALWDVAPTARRMHSREVFARWAADRSDAIRAVYDVGRDEGIDTALWALVDRGSIERTARAPTREVAERRLSWSEAKSNAGAVQVLKVDEGDLARPWAVRRPDGGLTFVHAVGRSAAIVLAAEQADPDNIDPIGWWGSEATWPAEPRSAAAWPVETQDFEALMAVVDAARAHVQTDANTDPDTAHARELALRHALDGLDEWMAPSPDPELAALQSEGHTLACARRIAYRDGVCECGREAVGEE